jgi:alanine racemase
MDQSMIDVTDLPVSVGDEVTVFGEDSASLSELAQLADTIEYECICLVSARVPRVKKTNARDNDIEKAGE